MLASPFLERPPGLCQSDSMAQAPPHTAPVATVILTLPGARPVRVSVQRPGFDTCYTALSSNVPALLLQSPQVNTFLEARDGV